MGEWIKKRKIKNIAVLFLVLLLMITGMALYMLYSVSHIKTAGEQGGSTKYDYHFVMIHSGAMDDFWDSLYQGAKKQGAKVGAYVEDFGNTVPGDYSTEELLEMAIAARVDGIVVEGNRSNHMKELIQEAEDNGITVITMMQDVVDSARKSFIGINDYSIGELYGNQAVEALEKRTEGGITPLKVTVVLNSVSQGAGTSLTVSKIKDTIAKSLDNVQVSELNIERDEDFESEEDIRNMAVNPEKRPDVIICLESVDTITCAQIITDYNLVGQVDIFGYYSSPEVLEGIQKGIIKSSVDVDAEAVGETCIQYLDKYMVKGYVNEFVTVDTKLITKANVDTYIQKEGGK